MLPAARDELRRVVLHIDMDCFYAQVERERLGLDHSVPLGVQQWDSLIAVNYPARAHGVPSRARLADAKKACPHMRCVHVETLDENGVTTGPARRETEKASLARYRRASFAIFRVFLRFVGEKCLEKASLDEAFLDVTSVVDERLASLRARQQPPPEPAPAWRVCGDRLDVAASEVDLRLAIGAQLADEMRAAVREDVGYTCSAGVAHNKMLAKLVRVGVRARLRSPALTRAPRPLQASPMNKPAGVSILPPRAVQGLFADMLVTEIRFLGGQLGHRLRDEGVETLGKLREMPAALLAAKYGDRTGRWWVPALRPVRDRARFACAPSPSPLGRRLYEVARGIDHAPVEAKWRPKVRRASPAAGAAPSPLRAVDGVLQVLPHHLLTHSHRPVGQDTHPRARAT